MIPVIKGGSSKQKVQQEQTEHYYNMIILSVAPLPAGGGADRPQVTPAKGLTPERNKTFYAEQTLQGEGRGGSDGKTIAKKSHHFSRTMTKKRSSVFERDKNRVTPSVAATPTLVTR